MYEKQQYIKDIGIGRMDKNVLETHIAGHTLDLVFAAGLISSKGESISDSFLFMEPNHYLRGFLILATKSLCWGGKPSGVQSDGFA